MKKAAPAGSPDEYVAALDGWRRVLVEELREGMSIDPSTARRLTEEAVGLNRRLGDPTKVARRGGSLPE